MTEVRLDADAAAEQAYFANPDDERRNLENAKLKDLNKIRLQYVESAKSLAETWVGFSIVMSIVQFIKPYGMHFEQPEFVAIVATALGSVIALWAIVGNGLFKSNG